MDLIKNNKVLLTLIVLLGFALRFLAIKNPVSYWETESFIHSFNLDYHFNFFNALKTNSYAFLYYYYQKIWFMIFKTYNYAALVPNLGAIIVMYFVGKNYKTKNSSTLIGLSCALISAISSFLIFFCLSAKTYSLVFLLASLTLLYSIKMFEEPSKKNFYLLTTFSILLILSHTIGFVYVLFNIFGLIAFKIKKKKEHPDPYMVIIASLILCLPLIPFLLKMFSHPTFISTWWSPFNFGNIFYLFTDFFSGVLKNISNAPINFYNQIINNNNINYGFLFFAIVPMISAIYLIVKANLESKRIDKYFLVVTLSTFLTILISAIAQKIPFLTKYYIELYPILILMVSNGWAQLSSKNQKVALGTIYIFMNLFYIVALKIFNIGLLS